MIPTDERYLADIFVHWPSGDGNRLTPMMMHYTRLTPLSEPVRDFFYSFFFLGQVDKDQKRFTYQSLHEKEKKNPR